MRIVPTLIVVCAFATCARQPAGAQTDLPVTLQVMGVRTVGGGGRRHQEKGWEGHLRLTSGSWSWGVGVRSTTGDRAEGSHLERRSTLGVAFEPRLIALVFGNAALYGLVRAELDRISVNDSGREQKPGETEITAMTLQGTITSARGQFGPGLLLRLGSRVNLDAAFTVAFTKWLSWNGDVDTHARGPAITSGQAFWGVGGWIGLHVGIF